MEQRIAKMLKFEIENFQQTSVYRIFEQALFYWKFHYSVYLTYYCYTGGKCLGTEHQREAC